MTSHISYDVLCTSMFLSRQLFLSLSWQVPRCLQMAMVGVFPDTVADLWTLGPKSDTNSTDAGNLGLNLKRIQPMHLSYGSNSAAIFPIISVQTPKPWHLACTSSPSLWSSKARLGSTIEDSFRTLPLIGSSFTQTIRANIFEITVNLCFLDCFLF